MVKVEFLLLEKELTALSGEQVWVPGSGLPASIDWVNALSVDPISMSRHEILGEVFFGCQSRR